MRRTWIIGLALAMAACSGGPALTDVTAGLADQGLVPLLEEAEVTAADLAEATAGFCDAPGPETLTAARDAWLQTETAWERAEVSIYGGPSQMLRTDSKVDFEPVSLEGIDELLASETVLDVDYVENRSAASRRGLGAIEYALFRPDEEAADERVCQLATSASAVVAESVGELAEAWTEGLDGAEPYALTYKTTMESNDALADVVGAYDEILKRQTLFELGAALGISSQVADMAAIPEGAAAAGADRLLAQLAGIETTLRAGGEDSLLELIRSRSETIAEQIEVTLADALSGLEEIDGSLRSHVEEHPEAATMIYDDLVVLHDLIAVDVVSLLDITLGFSDTDGDTG